jgi:ferredoxin-NADP reductase
VSSATRGTDLAARPGPPTPLHWRIAALASKRTETPSATTLTFDIENWPGHRAGQHVDLRLTAPDGYQAERSYSIASAPEDERLALTVEKIADGEVSPYLVDVMEMGDALELRGPIGGWFVWETGEGGPLLLVAGGSGVVPLRAMLRHHRAVASRVPLRLLYSARSLEEVIYRDELMRVAPGDEIDVRFTLTRTQPEGWDGYARRIDQELLAEVAWPVDARPLVYVCGPTGFVETAADVLVSLGHDAGRIRTERFGPT